MLSLRVIFWIFVIFFGMVGAMRGWKKEIVATTGLVLALFTIRLIGPTIIEILGMVDPITVAGDPDRVYRQQFWVLAAILLFIAFVSYQGPVVSTAVAARLMRTEGVQDKILGGLFGAVNGYLLIGSLLSFLEFRVERVAATGGVDFVRLPFTVTRYPFDPSIITRPVEITTAQIFEFLPLTYFGGNGLVLPLLLVVLVLFVLIAVV